MRFGSCRPVLLFVLIAAVLLLASGLKETAAQSGGGSITTDKAEYRVGEPIRVCVSVPGPSLITITSLSSGGSQVLFSGRTTGRGACIAGRVAPPAGSECLRLDYRGSSSGSAQTCYMVVDPSAPPPPLVPPPAPPLPAPPPVSFAPPSPLPPPVRFAGDLRIDGEPAPVGTTVAAWVGGQECGRIQISQAGRYSIELADAVRIPACGGPALEVRFTVIPPLPLPSAPTWEITRAISYQADMAANVDLAVHLAQLPPDPLNVPLTGWYWDDPTSILIWPECFPVDDRTRAAAARAITMWVDAAENRGLLTRLHLDPDACNTDRAAIVMSEVDRPDRPDVAVAPAAAMEDGTLCAPTDICAVYTGAVIVNVAGAEQLSEDDLSRRVAQTIGHILGLGWAQRCTGGTIMHEDGGCTFPARAIGVDDIASLNRRALGDRP